MFSAAVWFVENFKEGNSLLYEEETKKYVFFFKKKKDEWGGCAGR